MSWSEPLRPAPPVGPPAVPADLETGRVDLDARRWWVAVLLGLAMVGLGVWLLANLVESVVVLALVVGVSLITGGILDALVFGRETRARWARWVEGLLLFGAGIVVLAWPDITLWILTITAGLAALLGGLVQVVVAICYHRRPGWTIGLGLGALGVGLGAVVLAWPEATVVVVAILFGIRATVTGLVAIRTGWQLRRQASPSSAGAP